ncbi:MAG TPA: phosphosulfolactate synthase [Burkholderiales bacterium]|nr:phosphosulfolactate synthase [Burkholderiales bacterium]
MPDAARATSAPAFALPSRSGKPRRRGITSMIDFGPDTFGWTGGESGIRNVLEVAADYIDYAKIYAMNALLMPEGSVKRAARLYRDAGVVPFAGGILFEYAWQRSELDGLLALLARLDLPGLELSENYVTLSEAERDRVIERFQNAGLQVVYEFGRKNPEDALSIDYLAAIVKSVAAHGIHHVTVEQCEMDLLVRDAPDAIRTLAAEPWFDAVVIEADPYRFPQQHVELLRDFGPEANLANITPGQVLRLEGFRRGIGRAVNYSLLSGDPSHAAGSHI